ncbi:Dicarboxylate transport [Neptunomonas antarctica]|uniref:Dicarboxylate transport n=2 Tax=Neptunomonas antarctica TaxID=619304 RepID=A0A1N7NQQ0_9GAMM|nr:Dicarboxylate transport [Neptunomonas antarctica]
MKRGLIACLLATFLLPVMAYFSLPFIAKNVVESWLVEQGFQKPLFTVEYPSHKALLISQLSVEKQTQNRVSSLSAGPITITYDPWALLLTGELTRIVIPSASLDIAMSGTQANGEPKETDMPSFDIADLLPDQWLGFAPAEELVIGQLDIHWHGPNQPDYRFTGNIYLTQKQLLTRVLSSVNNHPIAHSDITLLADNRFQINVIDQNIPITNPIFRMVGQLGHDDTSITLQSLHSLDIGKTHQAIKLLELSEIEKIPSSNGAYSGKTELSVARHFTGNTTQWLASIKVTQHNQLTMWLEHPHPSIGRLDTHLSSEISLSGSQDLTIKIADDSSLIVYQAQQGDWVTAKMELKLDTPLNIRSDSEISIAPFKVIFTPEPTVNTDIQLSSHPISLAISDIDVKQQRALIVFNAEQVRSTLNKITLPAIQAQGKIYIKLPEIKTEISLASKTFPLNSTISITANLDKEHIDAQWRIKEIPLSESQSQWRPYLPFEWPEKLTLKNGSYTQTGHFQWFSGRLDGSLTHTIDNLSFAQDSIAVSGVFINSSTHLRGDRIEEQGSVKIDKIIAGTDITNLRTEFRLNKLGTDNSIANISHLSGNILGGTWQAAPFYTNLNPLNLNTDITLNELSLDELLKLEQQPGLSGEGRLEGNLPLRYDNAGFHVKNGKINARGPGIIRYQPDEGVQALRDSYIGLGIALDALSNFHYRHLTIQANYAPDGTLLLENNIEGTNPDWNNGQAVNFSVNIEENLLKLLKTLQFTDKLTETIEKRYRTP